MAFVPGYDKGVSIKPTGQGGFVGINVTGWKNADGVDLLDVTHSGTAGQKARIAGVLDVDGNIKANLDAANLPWAATRNIKAGATGNLLITTGTTNGWNVPYIIEKVNHVSEVGGLVSFDFDYKLESQSGTLSYPS